MRPWLTVPLTCLALVGAASAAPAAPAPATSSPTASAVSLASGPAAIAAPFEGTPRSAHPWRLGARAATPVKSVLVISIDGLTPQALSRLGRKRTPHLHRLLRQGTSTRNARTSVELTTTLPNHTGMVTGRRIDADAGGHGVTWNDTRKSPRTVHEAAGEHVDSVFTGVDAAGGRTALFAGKSKFSLWNRSWGKAIDRVSIRAKDARLAADVRTDLRKQGRMLRFWHIATPDRTGHKHGFMKRRYLDAVVKTDAMVGSVLRTIEQTPRLRKSVAIVLTSDHGATRGRKHNDPAKLTNQKVLFVAKGPGIARGADLYAINSGIVANPGGTQPAYDADLPPVRNGDAGNLALQLLGLPAIPGSLFNVAQDLRLVRPKS